MMENESTKNLIQQVSLLQKTVDSLNETVGALNATISTQAEMIEKLNQTIQ